MTDHADPQHIRHGADGTRAVPVAPDAAQAHARIVEALADPFAFAVALLGACGARSQYGHLQDHAAPAPPTTDTRPAPRKPHQHKPRTAEEILKPRTKPGGEMGPLSNRSRRDA
ncbi:hypothetical protein [Sphaerotilus sp.]|uniref:hypothetical protein n=1 Tax=Sphaerotilus sp. TaxID=2093942 RepID=UPI0034E20BD0